MTRKTPTSEIFPPPLMQYIYALKNEQSEFGFVFCNMEYGLHANPKQVAVVNRVPSDPLTQFKKYQISS